MTKQEFNRRIDKVIDTLSKNSDYSCLEIKAQVSRRARILYSSLFQPEHFEANMPWIIEDHGFVYDRNQSTLRVNMVELFRQKCLDENLYLEF